MLTPKASAIYSNQIRIHNNNTHTHLSFSLAAQVLLTNPVLSFFLVPFFFIGSALVFLFIFLCVAACLSFWLCVFILI
jgi:hypothetical protein